MVSVFFLVPMMHCLLGSKYTHPKNDFFFHSVFNMKNEKNIKPFDIECHNLDQKCKESMPPSTGHHHKFQVSF